MTRLDALLAGEVGTPVPGSDFALVLDALRAERAAHDVTASAAGAAARQAEADLARLNADLDAAHLAAARVVAERDALKARLDGIAQAHTDPFRRAAALDLAPHQALAEALRAYDLAAKSGVPLVAHAHALRLAARAAGIRTGEFFNGDRRDWVGLITACRAHVAREGRSEASDGFGLGQVGGAA